MLKSFRAQTYPNKRLLIYDNGVDAFGWTVLNGNELVVRAAQTGTKRNVGELRNGANDIVKADIIAHWDSDDWSHPYRLVEQVALLYNSNPRDNPIAGEVEAVSYYDMLFWDSTPGQFCGAWLYRSPNVLCPIGTSLMYRRKTWERQPFANRHVGEDLEWWSRVRGVMMSSLQPREPRMIAAIHGANTVPNPINPDSREWSRVPEWDKTCLTIMR
jgi:cellulose synthase/poly-beta-1,6-N-acetylglucosamine synthase-like glycosyltransferase